MTVHKLSRARELAALKSWHGKCLEQYIGLLLSKPSDSVIRRWTQCYLKLGDICNENDHCNYKTFQIG